MEPIKLGFAPTRRSIFSAPDAVRYARLTAEALDSLGVAYEDLRDINDEGLLYDDEGVRRAAEKFRAGKVDGLSLIHI